MFWVHCVFRMLRSVRFWLLPAFTVYGMACFGCRETFLDHIMEPEVAEAEILLFPVLPFKKIQMSEKYPKGHSRSRHWKHLKQMLQAENYQAYPANEPNYLNIESAPSMYPSKKFCDITGFEAPYIDPRTTLRYASADVLKHVRFLPNEYVQRYLSLRNAAVILK